MEQRFIHIENDVFAHFVARDSCTQEQKCSRKMPSEHFPLYLLDNNEGRKLSRDEIKPIDNSLLLRIGDVVSVHVCICGQEHHSNIATLESILPYLGGSIKTAADALPTNVRDLLLQGFPDFGIEDVLLAEVAEFVTIVTLGFIGVLGYLNIFPEEMTNKEDVLDCLTVNICRYLSIPLNAYSFLFSGFARILVFRLLVFCDLSPAVLIQEPLRINRVNPTRALVRFYEIASEIPLENFVDSIRVKKYKSLRMINSTLEKVLSEMDASATEVLQSEIQRSACQTAIEQFQTPRKRISDVIGLLRAYINMVSELRS
jgi:hypothetical protein